jgi:hypothetical protein
MWGWINDTTSTESATTCRRIDPSKARSDAAIQKELMSRQARKKLKDETEKNGLIIKEAIYKVTNGDEWDATIPLQFWVSHSTLTLPSRSKSELLGFYDVSAALKNQRSANRNGSTIHNSLSWSDIWDDLIRGGSPKDAAGTKQSKNLSTPTLTIKYDFKGQPYCITIQDEDGLRLPSPNATLLETNSDNN